jgi:DNA-binding Xre family transcriptional regulator
MNNYKQIIAWIVREKRGDMSFREASKECGISSATLYRLECGKRCDVETLLKVCRWTRQTPNYIFSINSIKDYENE